MREYSFTNDKRLLGNGINLSSLLHRLWGADANAQVEPCLTQRVAILAFIQSLPEQDIGGLCFLDGPRREVLRQLLETFGGTPTPYDASLLSDGILRVLAIAAAMRSAQDAGLVVVEEMDNGVRPSGPANCWTAFAPSLSAASCGCCCLPTTPRCWMCCLMRPCPMGCFVTATLKVVPASWCGCRRFPMCRSCWCKGQWAI